MWSHQGIQINNFLFAFLMNCATDVKQIGMIKSCEWKKKHPFLLGHVPFFVCFLFYSCLKYLLDRLFFLLRLELFLLRQNSSQIRLQFFASTVNEFLDRNTFNRLFHYRILTVGQIRIRFFYGHVHEDTQIPHMCQDSPLSYNEKLVVVR